MKKIPKEELIELIMELDIKYREVLLTFFELTETTHSDSEEIFQKIGISYRKYLELKQKGLFDNSLEVQVLKAG